jgi:hypothetical protein
MVFCKGGEKVARPVVSKILESLYPFTDQEPFPELISCLLASYNKSPQYELDAGAIFLTVKGKFRGVVVSGCS